MVKNIIFITWRILMNKTRVVYPGSFDPITNGHLDIIKRSANTFQEVYVAVLENCNKDTMFTIEERVKMIKKSVKLLDNVFVESFSGLTVEYAKSKHCNIIVRGLRAVSDYEDELKMALANRQLNKEIETLFLIADSQYTFLSSSTIKEISFFDGDISEFVPAHVHDAMKKIRKK